MKTLKEYAEETFKFEFRLIYLFNSLMWFFLFVTAGTMIKNNFGDIMLFSLVVSCGYAIASAVIIYIKKSLSKNLNLRDYVTSYDRYVKDFKKKRILLHKYTRIKK
jgi:hypothetical protein